MKTPPLFMVILVCALTGAQGGLSQTQEMSYFGSDAAVAAANCVPGGQSSDVPRNTPSQGRVDGRFILNSSAGALDPARPPISNTLFFIQIDNSARFYLSAGGNAFYGGDLVAWEGSWLLCLTAHSAHFNWVDVSRPFLRLHPDESSLTADGSYHRFRLQSYWRETDPMTSDRPLIGDHWIIE